MEQVIKEDVIPSKCRDPKPLMLCVIGFLPLLYLGHWRALTGKGWYWHDSIPAMTAIHLLFDSLYSAELPLWTPELNSGQPLWPEVETQPGFDPIAGIAWFLAWQFKLPSPLVYQWACVAWLISFAIGGMLCSKFLSSNKFVQAAVFLILFGSGIGLGLPAQSHGLLLPFRYTPLVLYCLIQFFEKPNFYRTLIFGLMAGFSLAGYQSSYSIFPILIFLILYTGFRFQNGIHLKKIEIKGLSLALLISAIASAPTLIAGAKMLGMIPLGRYYAGHTQGWTVPWTELFEHFFFWDLFLPIRLGGIAIGILPASFALLGLFRAFLTNRSPLEKTWVVFFFFILILATGSFGLNSYFIAGGTLLGLRNWGFTLTLLVLALSQLSVMGLNSLPDIKKYWRFIFLSEIAFIVPFFWEPHLTQISAKFFLICILLQSLGFLLYQFPKSLYLSFYILTCAHLCELNKRHNNLESWPIETIQKMPVVGELKTQFPSKRPFIYTGEFLYPYHNEGPTVEHRFYSFMLPHLPKDQTILASRYPTSGISNNFRTKLFHDLVISTENNDQLKLLLQNSEPMIEFRPDLHTTIWDLQLDNYSRNSLKLSIETTTPGDLIIRDSFDRDWRAFQNGRRVPIALYQPLYKEINIPAGHTELALSYRPYLYILAFWLRALAWGFFFLVILQNTLKGFFEKSNDGRKIKPKDDSRHSQSNER